MTWSLASGATGGNQLRVEMLHQISKALHRLMVRSATRLHSFRTFIDQNGDNPSWDETPFCTTTGNWIDRLPRTRPNPCWYGDDGIWAWGPVKIDAYVINHYVFKVVSQNLAYRQRVVYTWADVGPGAERHNSHRCTCMLTMLNSEKTLVLYVLHLGRFVSSMSWCLESALRRCELRHSVTLKAELRRSIEVVLAGHHFVADLSTWFQEVTDLSASSCFLLLWRPEWWHTGIVKKKKKKKLRLSRSLPFFLSTMLSNYAPFFLEKKRKKKKDRGRIFQQGGRQIYARSGKNLLACILSHPSRSETVKDVLFIRRKESTCAKQESWFNKWRIDVAFSSGCMSRRHFGVVARHPSGGGTSLLEGIFPLNWPIRARLFLLAPRPKSRRHHINKGWAWFEAINRPFALLLSGFVSGTENR